MYKLFHLTLLMLSSQIVGIGQNNINFIDSIADKACNELQLKNYIESIYDNDFRVILGKACLEYKDEWIQELKNIGNTGNFKLTELDYLLYHRLLQTCNKFRELDNNYQMRVITDDDYKKLYLTLKDFVLDAESDVKPEQLIKYFSTEIDRIELIEKIRLLQIELNKYKKTSGLFINNRGNQLYYYVNLFDYKTGDDNVAIKILFHDTKDNLIDEWDYKLKEDLNQVEEDLEIEEEMLKIIREATLRELNDTINRP